MLKLSEVLGRGLGRGHSSSLAGYLPRCKEQGTVPSTTHKEVKLANELANKVGFKTLEKLGLIRTAKT